MSNLNRIIEDTQNLKIRQAQLDTEHKNIGAQLGKIEKHMDTMAENMQDIRDKFSMYSGISTIKNRIWIVVYSFVTVCLTMGLHTLILKHFGLEV